MGDISYVIYRGNLKVRLKAINRMIFVLNYSFHVLMRIMYVKELQKKNCF